MHRQCTWDRMRDQVEDIPQRVIAKNCKVY